MTAAPLKIKCRRCNGNGYLKGMIVVYAGAPGGCFACAGYGEVYKDKFHRAFGVGKKFYGLTEERYYNTDNPNNGVFKMLATKLEDGFQVGQKVVSKDFRGRENGSRLYVELTEEQARRFWSRYQNLTTLGGVRVADYAPAR